MALIMVLEMRGANIRIVMVNGDNILTKVTMVRDCCTVTHGEDSMRFEAGVVRGKVKSEKVNNRNRDVSTLPLIITTSSSLYKCQPLSRAVNVFSGSDSSCLAQAADENIEDMEAKWVTGDGIDDEDIKGAVFTGGRRGRTRGGAEDYMGEKEDKKRHGSLYNYDARAPTVREESQTTHHESTESLEPANAVDNAAVAETNDINEETKEVQGSEGNTVRDEPQEAQDLTNFENWSNRKRTLLEKKAKISEPDLHFVVLKGRLKGVTATHVDDIYMAGKEGFHSQGARAPMSECGVGDLKVTKCDFCEWEIEQQGNGNIKADIEHTVEENSDKHPE